MEHNKEKQIEEMAKIAEDAIDNQTAHNCPYFPCRYHGSSICCDTCVSIEALYTAGYRKSTEFAEEIFAEIEKKIDLELSIIRKIIHAKGDRANGKTILLGKNQMLIDLKNFIAELKKKYTEEGK